MDEISRIDMKSKLCGIAALICATVISGCSTGYQSKTVAVASEINGCGYKQIVLSTGGEAPLIEYSGWSGECKGGFLSGPGYLVSDKYPGSTFTVFSPGKPMEFYIGIDETGMPGGYGQQVLGTIPKNHSMYNDFTDAECIAVHGCKIVRDAYLSTATDEQRGKLIYNSEISSKKNKEFVQGNVQREAEAKIRYAEMNRQIEEKHRADKQRWLAEKQAAQASSNIATNEMLTNAMTAAAQINQSKSPSTQRRQQNPQQPVRSAALAGAASGVSQQREDQGQAGWQPETQTVSNASSSSGEFSPAVNACIAIQPNSGVQDSMQIVNTCSFSVKVTYCTEGVVTSGDNKGRRLDNCVKRLWASKTLQPGGREIHNYRSVGVETILIACREPYFAPGNKLTYANGIAHGRCQK